MTVNLLSLLLPNRAFRRDMQGRASRQRFQYWAIRIAMAIVGILAILFFKLQQHPQLH